MAARVSESSFSSFDVRQVVGEDDRAEHGGDVQDLGAAGRLGRGDLLVLHGGVGSAEVHGQLGELLDTAAGADALVVDLDVGIGGLELTDPLDVERFREGGAGAVQGGG